MGIKTEIDRIEEGKLKVAQAITEKGVETANDASFNTLSENIGKIENKQEGIYKLTLSVNPQEGGVTSKNGFVENGMKITVSASPSTNYDFDGWSLDGQIISTETDYSFIMPTKDTNITANFEKNKYTISLSIRPYVIYNKDKIGTTNGATTINKGQSVTITATASDYTNFSHWEDYPSGTKLSTNKTYTFTPIKDTSLTAIFNFKNPANISLISKISNSFNASQSYIAYGNNKFVVNFRNNSSMAKIYYSSNGIDWKEASIPSGDYGNITYGNGVFVAIPWSYSIEKAIYSSDGINWKETSFSSSKKQFQMLQYGNNQFVALSTNNMSSTGITFIVSSDGVNWKEYNTSLEISNINMILGQGKCLILSANNKTGYSSTNFTDWNEFTLYGYSGGTLHLYDGNNFISSMMTRHLQYSSDGVTWKLSPTLPINIDILSKIIYANNKYLLCVEDGFLLSSENISQEWDVRGLYSNSYLSNIIYANNKFYTCTTKKEVMTITI